jgi:peptidoglycan/LPS O-acetylase OafA/YrhL
VPRCDALDWLKAIGITLVVYGHVAHASTVAWTPPIYVKQLGVSLFLFATGFTLARERRPAVAVLVRRLLPVYLYGLATAAAITMIGLVGHTGLAPSNYLPFLGGANVVFDHFPANPTTWYLGTYLHAVVLWAVWLQRVRVGPAMILVAIAIEIPARALLTSWAGPYVAYMLLTNWLAVFLAGLAWGARPLAPPRGSAVRYLAALVGGLAGWALAMRPLGFTPTFPFMTLDRWPAVTGAVAVSAAASLLYLSAAVLTFEAGQRVSAPRPVRFLARNSLIIVLVHMPVFMALNPVLTGLGLSYWSKVAIELALCLPGLAVLSAVIVRLSQPGVLADRALSVWSARHPLRACAAGPMPSLEHR